MATIFLKIQSSNFAKNSQYTTKFKTEKLFLFKRIHAHIGVLRIHAFLSSINIFALITIDIKTSIDNTSFFLLSKKRMSFENVAQTDIKYIKK